MVEGDFPAGVAHGGIEVLPMDPHQALAGEQPQPEEKRQLRIGRVLRQTLGVIQVRLLKHIGGIEPALQAAVQTQAHHPPQPFALPRHLKREPRQIDEGSVAALSRVRIPQTRLE